MFICKVVFPGTLFHFVSVFVLNIDARWTVADPSSTRLTDIPVKLVIEACLWTALNEVGNHLGYFPGKRKVSSRFFFERMIHGTHRNSGDRENVMCLGQRARTPGVGHLRTSSVSGGSDTGLPQTHCRTQKPTVYPENRGEGWEEHSAWAPGARCWPTSLEGHSPFLSSPPAMLAPYGASASRQLEFGGCLPCLFALWGSVSQRRIKMEPIWSVKGHNI